MTLRSLLVEIFFPVKLPVKFRGPEKFSNFLKFEPSDSGRFNRSHCHDQQGHHSAKNHRSEQTHHACGYPRLKGSQLIGGSYENTIYGCDPSLHLIGSENLKDAGPDDHTYIVEGTT